MAGTREGAAKRMAARAIVSPFNDEVLPFDAAPVPVAIRPPGPRYVVRRRFKDCGVFVEAGTDVTDMVKDWQRIESRVRAGLIDRVE